MYNPLDSVIEFQDPNREHALWQAPSAPLHLVFDLEYLDQQELSSILDELELDREELDSLEIYVERTEGQIDSIDVSGCTFYRIEDLPANTQAFLDNITFGDPEDPVISPTGERISFWHVVAGEPETQQAFVDHGYDESSDYFYVQGNCEPVDSVANSESKAEIKMHDGLETQVITEKVNHYMEEKEVNTKKRRRKRIGLFFALVLLCGILAMMYFIH